jgi:hypothetical protein
LLLLSAATWILGSSAALADPNYIGTPFPTVPADGPGIPTPGEVFGKEYTPTGTGVPGGGNITVLPPLHGFDTHQVTVWDANPFALPIPPGVDDAVRDFDIGTPEVDVDALANHGDLFMAPAPGVAPLSVVSNLSALLWSTTGDSGAGLASTAAPLLVEPIGGGVSVWATPPMINHFHPGTPLPNAIGGDMDGVEVWGADGAGGADSDRFSLLGDPGGTAIWANPVAGGASFPYVSTAMIAAEIAPSLGLTPAEVDFLATVLDLDGLMVWDDDDTALETGVDYFLFSIRPVTALGIDGGEIWSWTPGAAAAFLFHGGHLWDTAFDVMGTYDTENENVDGLEALAVVPEPASLAMMALGALAIVACYRRRKRAAV